MAAGLPQDAAAVIAAKLPPSHEATAAYARLEAGNDDDAKQRRA